jgi:hypothetical protein
VLNKTGLSANYDFALKWDPGQLPDSQKATVPVLVIDSADHPSDN